MLHLTGCTATQLPKRIGYPRGAMCVLFPLSTHDDLTIHSIMYGSIGYDGVPTIPWRVLYLYVAIVTYHKLNTTGTTHCIS